MSAAIDLDAYFARIGYTGPRVPALETLSRIHELHAASIPFENLSPLAGEPVGLDPGSLQAKLVRGGRGGWCFEHNLLLSHVLLALGFRVKRLAARVRYNVAPDVATARSHCLMLVPVDGVEYVADVGFGGLVLTGPLALRPGIEQSTPHERHRILLEGGGVHRLEASVAGEWKALYTFELNEAQVVDYEVSNWYLGHFPQSHFVTSLVGARAEPGRRHALRNTRYSIHGADGTEQRFATSVAELIEILEGPLAIRVPRSTRLEEKLARIVESNPPQ